MLTKEEMEQTLCFGCQHEKIGFCTLRGNCIRKEPEPIPKYKRNEVEEWESRYSTQGRERDAYESYRKFVGQKY